MHSPDSTLQPLVLSRFDRLLHVLHVIGVLRLCFPEGFHSRTSRPFLMTTSQSSQSYFPLVCLDLFSLFALGYPSRLRLQVTQRNALFPVLALLRGVPASCLNDVFG